MGPGKKKKTRSMKGDTYTISKSKSNKRRSVNKSTSYNFRTGEVTKSRTVKRNNGPKLGRK